MFISVILERKKKGINGVKINGNNIFFFEEFYKFNILGRNI